MKTQARLIISMLIGLTVGFGAGLWTGPIRNAAVHPQAPATTKSTIMAQAPAPEHPAGSPELQAMQARLVELRKGYTAEHPQVRSVQESIRKLEEKDR
jgi:hypothetical protein